MEELIELTESGIEEFPLLEGTKVTICGEKPGSFLCKDESGARFWLSAKHLKLPNGGQKVNVPPKTTPEVNVNVGASGGGDAPKVDRSIRSTANTET